MRQRKGGPICGGLIRGVRRASRKRWAYLRGAYTRSKACVKEKVGLSVGAYTRSKACVKEKVGPSAGGLYAE